MQSIDSPKYKGQSLLATWKRSPRTIWVSLSATGAICDIISPMQRFFEPSIDISLTLQHRTVSSSMPTLHIAISTMLIYNAVNLLVGSFVASHLEQARLNASDIRHATFAHAHLRSASFQRASLHHTNFGFCKSSSCQFFSNRISVGATLEAPILRRQKWKDAVSGCQINAQTVEASGWRTETTQWWLDQGAEWSENKSNRRDGILE